MGWRILTLFLAFAAMVAGIEGLRRLVAFWQGALSEPTIADVLLLAALPLVLWLWWRFVSPFGKGRGQCLVRTKR